MAKLTAKARRKSATIAPDKKHPSGRFPIPDKAHARNALARLGQAKGLSSAEKAKIRKRAEKKLGTSAQKRARK